MREELDALWQTRWADTPPVGHRLRGMHPERWVRFHSLPQSKRYPENEAEYAAVLDRHHAVLGALGDWCFSSGLSGVDGRF